MGEGERQRGGGPLVAAVQVGQDETAGVFRLEAPRVAPQGALPQVGDVLVGRGGDRPAGRQEQCAVGEPLVAEPVLQLAGVVPQSVVPGAPSRGEHGDVRGGCACRHRGAQGRRVGVRGHFQAAGEESGGEVRGVLADQRPASRGHGRWGDGGQGDPVEAEQRLVVAGAGRAQPGGLFEQDMAGDLAGCGAGHLGDLVELLGHLEVRELFPAGGEQGLRVESFGAGDDAGHRYFTERLVRFADDGDIGHARHPPQHRLDLAGVDVLAAPDDQFLDAAGHREVPGGVAAGQVAGAVPAVLDRLGGGLGLVVVPGHHARAAHPDLALGPAAHIQARLRVHQAHAEAGYGQAAGALDAGAAGPVDRDRAAGLRAAVRVEQRGAERLLEGTAQLRRGDRAADQAHAQLRRGEALSAGGPDQVVVHGGHSGQEGGGVLPERVEDFFGLEPVDDPRARADRGDTQHAGDVGQAVEERQRPQHAVVGGQSGDGGVAGGHGPQTVALCGQHALGPAGGARGVEHPGQVVESEVVPWPGGGFGGGQRLEGEASRGRVGGYAAAADDHDAQVAAVLQEAGELREVGGVGDDDAGAAVVEEVGQFGIGGTGVERRADRAGPGDGEVTLHHLHAVAEADGRTVPRLQPQSREVARQPSGALFQLGVGHAPAGVPKGDLAPEPIGVCPQEFGQRPDQFSTQHVTTSVG
ncbi:hypothetical protein ACVWYT_002607 [Streptomyces sp. TE4109]